MLCGMTSGSGSAQPGTVSIPEESSTPKDASTAAKISAPSHTQYLPFMKLFAMLLLIHGSLEVLVAAQICWLSFSSLGSLLSSVNMDRSLGALWTALQRCSGPSFAAAAPGSPPICVRCGRGSGSGSAVPESALRGGNLHADSCLQVLTDTLAPFCAYHLDCFSCPS